MENFSLIGVDGNAFSIMGYTAKALRQVGLSDKIEEMYESATKGNYYRLIAVCDEYITMANEKLNNVNEKD